MRKLFVLSLVLVAILALSVHLTILHINDTHGHAWVFNEWKNPGIGGFAVISTLVKEIKSEVESSGGHVLFLHAGDVNTGVPESDLLDAIPDILALNRMGLDAMALGNHEFDNPRSVLMKQMDFANFPFLSANIVYKKSGEPFAKPYIIKDFGDLKVAIIGVTTEETRILEPLYVQDLEFLDAVDAVQKYVNELKDKVDVIVVLSHLGWGIPKGDYNTSYSLARLADGVDVIVDGHSHDLMGKKVGDTIVVQAGYFGKWLGRLDLDIEDGKIVKWSWKALPINLKVYKGKDKSGKRIYEYQWKKIPEDPIVKNILDYFKAKGSEELNTVIGYTEVVLDGERSHIRAGTTNLGNLVADAMRWKVGADIAITNSGGIRTTLKPGPITIRDILTVHPFGNTLFVYKLKGDQILKILEYTATISEGKGAWPQVSGITYKSKDGKVYDVMVNGKPLDPNKVYTLVTNSYMAGGGDGYSMLKEWKGQGYDTGFTLSQVIMEYIQKKLGGKIKSYDDKPRYVREK